MNHVQQVDPGRRCDGQVQKTFDHIKSRYRWFVSQQIFTDFLSRLLRSLLRHAQEREHYQRQVSFKFFLSLLKLHLCGRDILTVKSFQSVYYGFNKFVLYIHILQLFSGRKDTKKEALERLLL